MTEEEALSIFEVIPADLRDKLVINEFREMIDAHEINAFTYRCREGDPIDNFFEVGVFNGMNDLLLSINLRKEAFENFSEAPELQQEYILKMAAAMRTFADELTSLATRQDANESDMAIKPSR